jgi:hypothetical protein
MTAIRVAILSDESGNAALLARTWREILEDDPRFHALCCLTAEHARDFLTQGSGETRLLCVSSELLDTATNFAREYRDTRVILMVGPGADPGKLTKIPPSPEELAAGKPLVFVKDSSFNIAALRAVLA